MRYFLIALWFLVAVPGRAQGEIEIFVDGLFENRAVLTINGKRHLMKVGETTDGVTLVSSDSRRAVVEANGRRQELLLSQHIAAHFSAASQAEVQIPKGLGGHYFTAGSINGYPVAFMVDTGATDIAMNMHQARRLGLDLKRGQPGKSNTAGGIVDTLQVVLAKVSVGSIIAHNIAATVVLGDHPTQILLGNSFLSKVEISEQSGVMMLRKKY